MNDSVLQAITRAALDATAAAAGWLLASQGDKLQIVATAGVPPGALLGTKVPASEGSAGFVIASGQPLALKPSEGDARATGGVSGLLGRRPSSVLCVPCAWEDTVVGALELVDKEGAATFSFDDLEVATLLGSIAGTALKDGPSMAPPPPTPAELARGLATLAGADPTRYAGVAAMLGALLDAHV
jgi:GAF domain-containing protein